MQYTRYIVLNGPPGSGKTTISRELARAFNDRHVTNVSDSFAAPMKHFVATALGAQYHSLPKEAPRAELAGYSVRESLIDLSEQYLKPRYGDGIFGTWLAHRIGRIMPSPSYVICDDGGFQPEVDALGRGKALIIRIERTGKSFANDSRAYLEDPFLTFTNNGDLVDLFLSVTALAKTIIEASRAK